MFHTPTWSFTVTDNQGAKHVAIVYRNSEWQEYEVRVNGNKAASYHCTDRTEAITAAKTLARRAAHIADVLARQVTAKRAEHQHNVEFNADAFRRSAVADETMAIRNNVYQTTTIQPHGCLDAPEWMPAGSMEAWPGDRFGVATSIRR